MKKMHKFQVAAVLVILAVTSSCGKSSFKLTGTLEGITDGYIILSSMEDRSITDTAKIENGNFVFTGDIPNPTYYYLRLEDKPYGHLYFYAENAKMTLKGHADSLNQALIEGGKTQDYANGLAKLSEELSEKYKASELIEELYGRKGKGPVTAEREAEINDLLARYREDVNQLKIDFIKAHSKDFYSVVLVGQVANGKSAEEIEYFINLLDPKFAELPRIVKLKEKAGELKKTEVSISSFIKDAHNLAYKVDKEFKGADHKDVVYLSIFSNNNVCALKTDGTVKIISPDGKTVKEFRSNLRSKPSSIAVDKKDRIFVFGSLTEKKSVEVRGKMKEIVTPVAVECLVFNPNGSKIKEIKLDGIVTATGAKVTDSNILVADTRGRKIMIYDSATGQKKSVIENLRTCCSILDFAIRNDNEVLVANLGAFRVEGFDYSGKPLISFGQRGNTLEDFHGCCNPVSVAFLSNGGVVTVEKDPTRIKVYSNEGAKKIEGIEELVKGCTYIPMTVDANDNVYLASKTGGIIKCIGSN
jgi:hypothetical protein